jgi:hypothetical protein
MQSHATTLRRNAKQGIQQLGIKDVTHFDIQESEFRYGVA